MITLGISGGIVPCPDALVVLLLGVGAGKVGLGLLLVALFSLGLALTLVSLGLFWVMFSSRLSRRLDARSFRWLGAAGAIAIVVIGALITAGAVARL